MSKINDATDIRRIGFLLLDGFSLISLGAALDPLRLANQLVKEQVYDLCLVSANGRPVQSSSGMEIPVGEAMNKVSSLSELFVVAGETTDQSCQKPIINWLRTLSRHGYRIGSLSGGVYLLARAGLLQNKSFSIHWALRPAFTEEFPLLEPSQDIFVIDGNCLSCAGGTSALDLMLWLIAENRGWDLAIKVAEQLIHPQIREGRSRQRSSALEGLGINHKNLAQAVEIMKHSIDKQLEFSEVAILSILSLRQMERLFQKYLKCSPSRFYLNLRLDHARHLLIYTPMLIIEVAIAAGFNSSSYFSKAYREHFGITPGNERKNRQLYAS